MKYSVFLIILLSSLSLSCMAQQSFDLAPIKIDLTAANKYNDGRKHGLWCEQADSSVTICYYKNGVRFGTQRTYKLIPETDNRYYLHYMAIFKNGNTVGPQYYFYTTGLPKVVILDQYKNRDFKISRVECSPTDVDQAFIQKYSETTGQLEAEGWVLILCEYEYMNEEVGQWTVYDERGNSHIIQKGLPQKF